MTNSALRRTVPIAVLVLVVLLVVWVASAGGHATESGPRPVPTGPADTTVTVTVTDGEIEPPPGRVAVRRGDVVAVTVTSDVADELHVHGIDVRTVLEPGAPATLKFVADQTGMFEVETHNAHTLLFQLLVR